MLVNITRKPLSLVAWAVSSFRTRKNNTFIYSPKITRGLLFRESITEDPPPNKMTKWKRFLNRLFSSDSFLALAFIAIFYFYADYGNNSVYWLTAAYGVAVGMTEKFTSLIELKRFLPYPYLRFYLCAILFYTPIMSFAIGKARGINVYTNKEIKYISDTNINKSMSISDTIPLKLLGFLGDKFIVSSLDNKKIIVLNQSSFEGVMLLDSLEKVIKADTAIKVKEEIKAPVLDSTKEDSVKVRG